jgi:hypothetical protein
MPACEAQSVSSVGIFAALRNVTLFDNQTFFLVRGVPSPRDHFHSARQCCSPLCVPADHREMLPFRGKTLRNSRQARSGLLAEAWRRHEPILQPYPDFLQRSKVLRTLHFDLHPPEDIEQATSLLPFQAARVCRTSVSVETIRESGVPTTFYLVV